jgi:DNA polymerase
MDPKDLLRRYLEQRREMGESEFALDSMSVEEAMRIVGGSQPRSRSDASRAERTRAVELPPRSRDDEAPAGADWREALRAASGEPAKTVERPAVAEPAPVPTVAPSGIVVGDGNALPLGDIESLPSLDVLADAVRRCTRCRLYQTATQGVPGEGSPNTRFVCVGEAPGATEDETGRPFVGAAGQLLTKILAAIELRREDVFICNVIKHRPPGNRNPLPDEIAACSPYLIRQLELIKPAVILALGTFAAQTLLETKESIGKLRGRIHRYHGIPLVVTYHPAALLRNPSWKRPTWDDVQLARRILDSHPVAGA